MVRCSVKRVVGISLGSSTRDETSRVRILSHELEVSRIGTDGDLVRFAELMREWDGKADAIGLGGIDRYLWIDDRRYVLRDADRLARIARVTPVVDGSGIKNTVERKTIAFLHNEGIVDFRASKVLLVCAVDRFGMAQSIADLCPNVIYGDLMFNMGIPIPMRSYATVRTLGKMFLPLIVKLPFKWLYPTGAKQETTRPKYHRHYGWADVVAGDFHLIRRTMPEPGSGLLDGKVVVTNTVTRDDVRMLAERGVRLLVTSTPEYGGRRYGNNVFEAMMIAMLGKHPDDVSADDYETLLNEMQWKPDVARLQAE